MCLKCGENIALFRLQNHLDGCQVNNENEHYLSNLYFDEVSSVERLDPEINGIKIILIPLKSHFFVQ